MENVTIIGETGGNNELQVYSSTYKEKAQVHIREMYYDRATDSMLPGKKGIALKPENVQEVIDALQKLV